MKHINSGFMVAFATTFMLGGCSSVRVADLTLVSTKNIDLSDTRLDIKAGTRQEGKDCVFFVMPNLKNAIDKALEAGGGNVMVDQVTYVEPGFFYYNCIRVEGTVLRTN